MPPRTRRVSTSQSCGFSVMALSCLSKQEAHERQPSPGVKRRFPPSGARSLARLRFSIKCSPPMSDNNRPGILPNQSIEALIAQGSILSEDRFDADQVQQASLDLRLGSRCWRVRASFLPGRHTVAERIRDVAMHELDLSKGAVLERGCV